MKITCTKRSREDIIRDRDEYDAKRKAIHDKADEEMKRYREDLYATYDTVRAEIQAQLANFESLNLDIQVNQGYRSGLEVNVRSNDANVHDPHKALSWNWRVWISKEGEVQKESGSWSGLQATTAEQLESLRQSVACLEILNSIDWVAILSTPTPNEDDYFTVDTYEVDRNRPNFEQELLEAEISEIIGKNKLVESKRNEGKYYRGTTWFGILGETSKMYKVFEVPAVYVEAIQEGKTLSEEISTMDELISKNSKYSYNVTKEKFFRSVIKPLNILEA